MRLDAAAVVPDRPFTSPAATQEDLAILARMLGRLRGHIASIEPSAAGASRDDRVVDPTGGGIHRIVLTDIPRAREAGDLVVVGFFGQARAGVDHEPIVALESALIDGMAEDASHPLVYYNVHWPGVGWGNLVLFRDMNAKDSWGHDPRHAEAVARSPAHYHSIRLHVGTLAGGLVGRGSIELRRTRYFDFTGAVPWTAVREIG